MRTVFADTFYWIALLDTQDDWNKRAKDASKALGQLRIVTSDSVLLEFVNFFSSPGHRIRQAAGEAARRVMNNPNHLVLPQSRDLFNDGLALFNSRPDKGYSLTDCISMVAMRKGGIREVLTHDHHFEQEGFVLLLRE
jgi:uncharacterized protein